MKTKLSFGLSCAAVALTTALISPLRAQEKALPNAPAATASPRADTSALSRSDRNFLEKAAKSGMKEVAVSQAVQARLTDPQVKAFAEMMVSDHTGANSELVALAARKGVTLPTDEMKDAEKWSKKTKDLDGDYLSEMKEDHDEAVKLFEKGAKADDAEIAAFARKTLPTLQHHHTMVQQLKKSVK